MYEFLSSDIFKYFILPLSTVVLTAFIKLSSRPDKFLHFTREDFAVGINLCVTAIFVNITKCVIVATNTINETESENIKRYSDLILSLLIWSIGMLISAFVMALLMRIYAWEFDGRRMKLGWGVLIPDIVGLVFLVISSAQPIE